MDLISNVHLCFSVLLYLGLVGGLVKLAKGFSRAKSSKVVVLCFSLRGIPPSFLHQSTGFLKFFLSGAAGGLQSLLIRNQSIYGAWWGCRSGEIVANRLPFCNFTEAKNVFVSFKNTDR